MTRDTERLSCLICVIMKLVEIWMKCKNIHKVFTPQISTYNPLIKEVFFKDTDKVGKDTR